MYNSWQIKARFSCDGQIENAVNKLRDAMLKHRSEINSEVAQQVLDVENLGMMMFAPFLDRTKAVSNLIVRKVKVKHKCAPKKALDATDRKQYTDSNVLDSMPEDDTSLSSHKYYFP